MLASAVEVCRRTASFSDPGLTIGLLLLTVCGLLLANWLEERKSGLKSLPGPFSLPLLGCLHLLAAKRIPFSAFTDMIQQYGPVVGLRLGITPCAVVQSEELIREVLITKADHFDSRPNFVRFNAIFGGSKKNALAFCDYDDLQKARKKLLCVHTFPRYLSVGFKKLDEACRIEMSYVMETLRGLPEDIVDMKPIIAKACSNIFNSYFCDAARVDYADAKHSDYIQQFDHIFWEVNNGRFVDFFPSVMPFMRSVMSELSVRCATIRRYVLTHIVEPRTREQRTGNLLDSLLQRVEDDEHSENPDTKIDMECALYALEDILGGHCAVANITIRLIHDIGTREDVQRRLRAELSTQLADSEMSLDRRYDLPYLTACFYETLRTTSSAIVPHMANRDTSISGYRVPANTVVFINNHNSNYSPDLWDMPLEYMPERFITPEGVFRSPSHFLPFSVGRRSCIGYKIVQMVSIMIVANVFRNIGVKSDSGKVFPGGMLALPPEPFHMELLR